MITVAKGEIKPIEFTLYAKAPTEGSTPQVSNLSGATIIFSVFNNRTSLTLLYRANGTIVSAADGTFTVPITIDLTKQRGTLYYTVWATYANGNKFLWIDGDFTVNDKGGYQ